MGSFVQYFIVLTHVFFSSETILINELQVHLSLKKKTITNTSIVLLIFSLENNAFWMRKGRLSKATKLAKVGSTVLPNSFMIREPVEL